MYWEEALEIQKKFLDKLEAQDKETLNLITKRYVEMLHTLEQRIDEVSVSQSRAVYSQLIKDLRTEISKFNIYSSAVIASKQEVYIQLGLQSSQQIIGLMGISFQKLNPEALRWIVGNSMEGGRLYDLLMNSYPQTVERISKTISESVLIGRNPRLTARMIRDDMNGNLSRALRISRTETIMAFREASREQMIKSGLIKEWEWVGEEDACDYCSSMEGKHFPITESMDTHPNCRCTGVPVI